MTEHQFTSRYKNLRQLRQNGVSLFVENDELGQRLNCLTSEARAVSDPLSTWSWRVGWLWAHCLIDRGQNSPSADFFHDLEDFVNNHLYETDYPELLNEFISILDQIAQSDGSPMLHAIADTVATFGLYEKQGISLDLPDVVVVVRSRSFAIPVAKFVKSLGVPEPVVTTFAQLRRSELEFDAAIFLGPPKSFPSAVWSAPVSPELTYVLPNWVRNVGLPESEFQKSRGVGLKPRVRTYGVCCDQDSSATDIVSELFTEAVPSALVEAGLQPSTEPKVSDEANSLVDAREIELQDGQRIMLPISGKIRAIDGAQQKGNRVRFIDVDELRPGHRLLLRTGSTDEAEIDRLSARLLGSRRAEVEHSQERWKSLLKNELDRKGFLLLERLLRNQGVQSSHRIEGWIEPRLISPRSQEDFRILLTWLGADVEKSMRNAADLDRARRAAKNQLRREMEDVAESIDYDSINSQTTTSLQSKTGVELPAIVGVVEAVAAETKKVRESRIMRLLPESDKPWLN